MNFLALSNMNISSTSKESKNSGRKPGYSQALQTAFSDFIENHPAKRFRKNLSRMIIAHMIYESHSSSPYMAETLLDLEGLFVLLDAIEEETEAKKV